ncbi:MAG: BrnA antitoxin family protein [Myxococcales bacterium]|nr:BrnA antitoxin family protein [Myxococcales bacterium]
MNKNYDFSEAVRNPYAKQLKKQLTIRVDTDTISYFQQLAQEYAVPYQTLMNMYLRDCATTRARPHWAPGTKRRANKGLKTDKAQKVSGRLKKASGS